MEIFQICGNKIFFYSVNVKRKTEDRTLIAEVETLELTFDLHELDLTFHMQKSAFKKTGTSLRCRRAA